MFTGNPLPRLRLISLSRTPHTGQPLGRAGPARRGGYGLGIEGSTVFLSALLKCQREGRLHLVSVASGAGGTNLWGGNGSDLGDLHRCKLRLNPREGLRSGRGTAHQVRGNPGVQGILSTSSVLTPRGRGGLPPWLR